MTETIQDLTAAPDAGRESVPPERAPQPWELTGRWLREHPDVAGAEPGVARLDPIDAAVSSGAVSSDAVAGWWASQLGLPRWDGRSELPAAVELADVVAFEFAIDHLLLLFSTDLPAGDVPPSYYQCLTARPWRWQALDNLSAYLGAPLQLWVGAEIAVRDVIGKVYDQRMAQSEPVVQASGEATDEKPIGVEVAIRQVENRDLLATAGKEPVAKLVDSLLYDASRRRASDVHVHPYPDRIAVRYRVDGVLHDCYQLPRDLQDQVVGRIKVLAGMDVAEKRLAQDGRTSVQVGSRQIDLRVSSLPTTCGERVVIRLLEQTAQLRRLGELGMPADTEKAFGDAIGRSNGLVLVTGPTGSGKTTTLYSALAQLDARAKNILTVEDPVEYRLAGISQTQVSDKKGMTFLSGLRHILRQDPDVIMVGEIRDEATARMVIQSSLTGHLVLSTLHTNNAAGAIARLMDLGVEPFLIASSLIGCMAQRLVRTCCPACRGSAERRCAECGDTGYSGRMALFEWLQVNQAVRGHVLAGASAEQVEAAATAAGMRTLKQSGDDAVARRVTTEAELLRVLGTIDS